MNKTETNYETIKKQLEHVKNFDGFINFRNLFLDKLDYDLFKNVKNARKIDISSNQIKHIDLRMFQGLDILSEIDFSSNEILKLECGIFRGLKNLSRLNLSSNQLKTLDSNLFEGLNSLEWINFSSNQITQLDANLFRGLEKLSWLNFSSNQITKLDANLFNGLADLKVIYFSSNQIRTLDSNLFRGLRSLNLVYFNSNQIKTLDSNLFKGLTSLNLIHFSSNKITELDPLLFNELESLCQINFSENKISNLDSSLFEGLNNLCEIHFSSNQITKLNENIFQKLNYLREIDFSLNQITRLDSRIFQGLVYLEVINFRSNQITQLDSGIFNQIKNVKAIDFSENKISKLDADIFQSLDNLEWINFSENKIKSLDPNIFQDLTNLKRINMSSNHITQLDSNIFQGLESLKGNSSTNDSSLISPKLFKTAKFNYFNHQNKIKKPVEVLRSGYLKMQNLPKPHDSINLFQVGIIDFSFNKILQLDSNIFNDLTDLDVINFSSNQIKELDANTFQGLINLKEIYFCSNRLTRLAWNIFHGLDQLRRIYFNSNQINQLDSSIFQGLSSLKRIDFSSNQIGELAPCLFTGLDSLIAVNFSSNNLKHISCSLFSNLSRLQVILFNSNFFSSIPSDIFSSLKQLQQVDFKFDYSLLNTFSSLDYISIFNLFFTVDEGYKYDFDLDQFKFEPDFRTNESYFKEFLNMYCLSKITNADAFDFHNLEKSFSSHEHFSKYYSDKFTPLDFLLEIKSVSNKTIANILKHGKYIFNNYKFDINQTGFHIKNIESVHLLCERNNQQLMDELSDFFNIDDFVQCWEIALQDDCELVAIFIFNIYSRRIMNDVNNKLNYYFKTSPDYELENMTDFNKYSFLERCFNKKWWTLFQKILEFKQQIQADDCETKMKFYRFFEDAFEKESSKTKWNTSNFNDIESKPLDDYSNKPEEILRLKTLKNARSNHFLHFIASSRQSGLIKHPTTLEFLQLKWENLPRRCYYFHLWLFILFVVLYSINLELLHKHDSTFYRVTRYLCIIIISIFLIEELVQFVQEIIQFFGSKKFTYFNFAQNVAEFVIYPLTLVSLLINSFQAKTALYSFTILFLYAILILRLEKFSAVGIYVTVFKRIVSRSARVLPLIIFTSLAFLFSFRISSLRSGNSPEKIFHYNGSFMFNFIELMTLNLGDFDNDQMGLDDNIDGSNWPMYIIYLIFLFVIPILILNIFIGISVDEMTKLIDQSQEYNTRIKIEYTLKMQDALLGLQRVFKRIRPIHYMIGKFIAWGVLIDIQKIKYISKRVEIFHIKHQFLKTSNRNNPGATSKQMNKFHYNKIDKLEQNITELDADIEQIEQRLNNNISNVERGFKDEIIKVEQRLNANNEKIISSIDHLTKLIQSYNGAQK